MAIYDPADDNLLEDRDLIDLVLDQIAEDLMNGDLTALEELLKAVPDTNLKSYLTEVPYA
jgi:hypothetical protein